MRQGQPIPETWRRGIPLAGQPYWRAWRVLDEARPIGGGSAGQPNPISYEAMRTYARDHQLPIDDTVMLLQGMEREYFQVHSARLAALRARAERGRSR